MIAVLGCTVSGISLADTLPDGFVRLSDFAPEIEQDMRYAGTDNFLGRVVPGYEAPECILTREAAEALRRAEDAVLDSGYGGLVVYDCYRPQTAVAAFVAHVEQGGPADPQWHPNVARDRLIAEGYVGRSSAHSRGSTVDIGLTGRPLYPDPDCGAQAPASVPFGTGFDCFDPMSRTASTAIHGDARRNRHELVAIMDGAGFDNYAGEWWHFTLRDEPYPGRAFDFPVTAAD